MSERLNEAAGMVVRELSARCVAKVHAGDLDGAKAAADLAGVIGREFPGHHLEVSEDAFYQGTFGHAAPEARRALYEVVNLLSGGFGGPRPAMAEEALRERGFTITRLPGAQDGQGPRETHWGLRSHPEAAP